MRSTNLYFCANLGFILKYVFDLDFHAIKLDFEAKITLLTFKSTHFETDLCAKIQLIWTYIFSLKTFNFGTKIQN